MILPLTPATLEAAYNYLRSTPPFVRWRLPPGGDVKFGIIRSRDRQAHYFSRNDVHHIEFSSRYVGTHANLLSTMAHEIIHLHMSQTCLTQRNPHDATFRKYADRVCKIHGFDRLMF